jgi:uncharacterized membrane protein YhfC
MFAALASVSLEIPMNFSQIDTHEFHVWIWGKYLIYVSVCNIWEHVRIFYVIYSLIVQTVAETTSRLFSLYLIMKIVLTVACALSGCSATDYLLLLLLLLLMKIKSWLICYFSASRATCSVHGRSVRSMRMKWAVSISVLRGCADAS